MALDFNGQLFQDLKLKIAEYNTARDSIDGVASRQETFDQTVGEPTERIGAHRLMDAEGNACFDGIIGSQVATMNSVVAFATSSWLQYAADYLTDFGNVEIATVTLQNVLQVIQEQMEIDDEDVDASVIVIGTPTFQVGSNQGDGSASIAVNDENALAQLPVRGQLILQCLTATYDNQNEERWVLRMRRDDPRGIGKITLTSASRNFITDEEFIDVATSEREVFDDAKEQIPQRAPAIHTGLKITISIPSYVPTDSGDTNNAFDNFSFTVGPGPGTKTNVTKRNTTFAGSAVNPNGTVFLRCVDLVGAWNLTVFKDAALTVALTETLLFTEGDGDKTLQFRAVDTNPEHLDNGGHLSNDDDFMTVDIDDSNIQLNGASFTVTLLTPLPWGRGDKIFSEITDDQSGTILRFFKEELGFALRNIADTTESIPDPV